MYCLVALSLAALIHSGASTKCFICSSVDDPKCADPMLPDSSSSSIHVKECTSQTLQNVATFFNSASKKISDIGSALGISNSKIDPINTNFVCSKIDLGDGDKKVSIRGCSPPLTDKVDPCKIVMEQQPKEKDKVVTYCGLCETDLCNSATPLQFGLSLLVPLLALLR